MKIAIIGGGASGLFCAGLISKNIEVDLFEKNASFGKKLMITGNGRCNITNLKSPQDFLQNVPFGSKFLTSALHGFSPYDMQRLLTENHVDLIEEQDNKIFPKSGKSKTILDFLMSRVKENVKVKTDSAVSKITKTENGYTVFYNDKSAEYDSVIIATGGKSYSGTGSSGDGYTFAQSLGHKVTFLRQSLCGLKTDTAVFKNCSGVSFEGLAKVIDGSEEQICSENGNILFTHFGVSGPAIHRLTSKFNKNSISNHILSLDFIPYLTNEELLQQLNIFADINAKKDCFAFIQTFLPKSFVEQLKENHSDLLHLKCSVLNKQKRLILVDLLKNYKTKIYDFDTFDRAIVTRGGVDLAQIDPKTMESKLNKNLFFLGEVLDVDGLTGGYNLQISFSTAFACAKKINGNLMPQWNMLKFF